MLSTYIPFIYSLCSILRPAYLNSGKADRKM